MRDYNPGTSIFVTLEQISCMADINTGNTTRWVPMKPGTGTGMLVKGRMLVVYSSDKPLPQTFAVSKKLARAR